MLIIPSHNPQIDLIVAVFRYLESSLIKAGLSCQFKVLRNITNWKNEILLFVFPSISIILSLHSQSWVRQWTSNLTNEARDVSTRALWSVSTYYSVEPSKYKVGGSVVGRKGQEGTTQLTLRKSGCWLPDDDIFLGVFLDYMNPSSAHNSSQLSLVFPGSK